MGSESEEELIAEIKEAVRERGKANPKWRYHYGSETLTAQQVILRMDKDKKFCQEIKDYHVKLAIKMVRRGRLKDEGAPG